MKPKYIIIFGSSRSDGFTRKAVELAFKNISYEFIDLSKLSISEFDYSKKNKNDDFIPLIKKIQTYEHIVFASPIYWHGPSSRLKIFIDRLSDLLVYPLKNIGKSMVGKNIYIVSSNGTYACKIFENQFKLICNYLKMNYVKCYHYHSGKNQKQLNYSIKSLSEFRKKIY